MPYHRGELAGRAQQQRGERAVLGVDIGPSEDGAFWLQCLRALVAPGPAGLQPVISDAHAGFTGAIAGVLGGASWQRCRVHVVRNVRALVPKAAGQMVGASICTVLAAPEAQQALAQWRKERDGLVADVVAVGELF
jgi:transposase-like protein